MSLALALQAALLRLAPRAFRERFGAELLDVAERVLADERRERGPLAAALTGARQVLDLAMNVLRLQRESPTLRTTLLLLFLALLAAAGTGWVDTHAEEVQPAVLLLLVSTAVLSFLDPRRALLWWLVLGLSVPAAHLWVRVTGRTLPYEMHAYAGSFLALVPAALGAAIGLGSRRLLSAVAGSSG